MLEAALAGCRWHTVIPFSSSLGVYSSAMCQELLGSSVSSRQSIISQTRLEEKENGGWYGGGNTDTERKGGRRKEGNKVIVYPPSFIPPSLIMNLWDSSPISHSCNNSSENSCSSFCLWFLFSLLRFCTPSLVSWYFQTPMTRCSSLWGDSSHLLGNRECSKIYLEGPRRLESSIPSRYCHSNCQDFRLW